MFEARVSSAESSAFQLIEAHHRASTHKSHGVNVAIELFTPEWTSTSHPTKGTRHASSDYLRVALKDWISGCFYALENNSSFVADIDVAFRPPLAVSRVRANQQRKCLIKATCFPALTTYQALFRRTRDEQTFSVFVTFSTRNTRVTPINAVLQPRRR